MLTCSSSSLHTLVFPLCLTIFFGVVGCASPTNGGSPAQDHSTPPKTTNPCLNIEIHATLECAKANFWKAFQIEFDKREQTYHLLSEIIDALPSEQIPYVFFLRGTLASAMMAEDGLPQYSQYIVSDLKTAEAIDPDYVFYKLWRVLMELYYALLSGDDALTSALIVENIQLAEESAFNAMSLIGTWPIFPLSTGLPQKGAEILDTWECGGELACSENQEHIPHAQNGIPLYMADVYIRVQQKDKAIDYLNEAILADGAADWKYSYVVKDVLSSIDERITAMGALGDDDFATAQVIMQGPLTCRPCHAK